MGDIGNLTNQELINLMVMIGVGALIFGGMFVASLFFQIRKHRKPKGSLPNVSKAQSASSPYQRPNTTGGGNNMSLLKSSGKKRENKAVSSPQPTAENSRVPVTASAPALNSKYRELLRVLVNVENNEIVLEVDGVKYQTISQVKERSIGKRILETAAGLLKFTGGYIATATGMKTYPVPEVELSALPAEAAQLITEPEPATEPVIPQPPLKTEQAEPISDEGARFLAQLEAQTQSLSGSSNSGWSEPAPERHPEPEADKTEPTGFNLAEEIDEIVQRKLVQLNNPTKIKIHSGLGGMIQIEAGNKFYNAVDEIEDPTVQQIIQSAIDEWNSD